MSQCLVNCLFVDEASPRDVDEPRSTTELGKCLRVDDGFGISRPAENDAIRVAYEAFESVVSGGIQGGYELDWLRSNVVEVNPHAEAVVAPMCYALPNVAEPDES